MAEPLLLSLTLSQNIRLKWIFRFGRFCFHFISFCFGFYRSSSIWPIIVSYVSCFLVIQTIWAPFISFLVTQPLSGASIVAQQHSTAPYSSNSLYSEGLRDNFVIIFNYHLLASIFIYFLPIRTTIDHRFATIEATNLMLTIQCANTQTSQQASKQTNTHSISMAHEGMYTNSFPNNFSCTHFKVKRGSNISFFVVRGFNLLKSMAYWHMLLVFTLVYDTIFRK